MRIDQVIKFFYCCFFHIGIDPCSGVFCGDNANCVNGTCVCEFGFEGDGNVCTRKWFVIASTLIFTQANLTRRKSKVAVILDTRHFDIIDSAVISSVSKTVQNWKSCSAFLTLLQQMLSKRPVSRTTLALLFLLKLFSSHIYCIPNLMFSATTIFCRKFTDVFLYFVHFILHATLNCWAFSKCNSRYQHWSGPFIQKVIMLAG